MKTTLGEVCAFNPRIPFLEPLPDDTEVSFVPMAAVEEESGRLDASQTRTLGSVRRGYTPFIENDVIFAKITPCMENGKIALATGLKNGLAYGSTEFFVFRPYDGLLPRFLLHFLLQPSLREDAEHQMAGASGQKRVPASYLLNHEFSLPPTREQERILAKLDATLSRLERAETASRRARERVPPVVPPLTLDGSHCYKLFVATKKVNSFGIKQIHALCAKHPGWGYLHKAPL